MRWRVLPLEIRPSQEQMAVDETLLEFVSRGDSPPTIRIFYWAGKGGVSIGRADHSDLVNLENCKRDGVSYSRRITGGKPLYHHPNDLSYSVIAPHHIFFPEYLQRYTGPFPVNQRAYDTIRDWISFGLQQVGFDARSESTSEIVVGPHKICGSAQKPRPKAFFQHGSIFVESTPEVCLRYLNFSPEQFEALVPLRQINPKLDKATLYDSIYRSFTQNPIVDGNYDISGLTEEEQLRVVELTTQYRENFYGTGRKNIGPCATTINNKQIRLEKQVQQYD